MSRHPSQKAKADQGQSTQFDEPRLLLPTKVYPHNLEDLEDGGNYPSSAYQAYPNSLVQWAAQPVLKWVESLAAATENAELEAGVTSMTSGPHTIKIGGIKISQTSCTVARRIASNEHRPEPSSPTILTLKPKHFDATFLLEQDRHAWTYVQKMNQLAFEIEASLTSCHGDDSNQPQVAPYQMISTRLEFTFGRIMTQFPYETSTDDREMRLLLDTLYDETIRKLQSLIDAFLLATRNVQSRHTISSEPTTPVASNATKRDLGTYMTNWLLQNWTNPYPDDDGLVQLAHECGSSATVVSNWLINARTRKWRPAIVKATALDRPSSQLLEDSIHIFKGTPLRVLEERLKKRARMEE